MISVRQDLLRMPRNWTFALHDTGVVAQLSRELNCSPLLAQVLAARGLLTKSDAALFLQTRLMDLHDPNLLPGASEAVPTRCGQRDPARADEPAPSGPCRCLP